MILMETMGIGCDIEEIQRFCLDRIKDAGFLKKVFTDSELEYCFSFENPAPHLAARFCAKEAVVKALSSAGRAHAEYGCIEIGNLPSGVPFVTILSDEQDDHDKEYVIRLSMSHCTTTAMAVAIISRISRQEIPPAGTS